uniref:Uncharacterized protein n=1 Tax=Anguilla anguilla TaxID=7936 RepID=A0A0E9RSN5_ANGAN
MIPKLPDQCEKDRFGVECRMVLMSSIVSRQ